MLSAFIAAVANLTSPVSSTEIRKSRASSQRVADWQQQVLFELAIERRSPFLLQQLEDPGQSRLGKRQRRRFIKRLMAAIDKPRHEFERLAWRYLHQRIQALSDHRRLLVAGQHLWSQKRRRRRPAMA